MDAGSQHTFWFARLRKAVSDLRFRGVASVALLVAVAAADTIRSPALLPAPDVPVDRASSSAYIMADDEPSAPAYTILEAGEGAAADRIKKVAQLTQEDDEDIEKIKAHTMHKMVTDIYDGGDVVRVLFLTRKQAELVSGDTVAIERMLTQGFDVPDPKLVINLLASRDEPARFATLINLRRELIDQYMTDVILPLAEENAAVIICSAEAKSCCLSESLTRVLRLHRARWPSRMSGWTGE